MTYLYLLTIGPVQSFIAQARKTHDLFAGSRMLSNLCRAGIKHAQQQWGTDCIINPNEKADSIPNRFLAKITSSDDEQTLTVKGKAVEDAVRTAFSNYANDAVGKLNKPSGFDAQIDRQLDIQWLFVPIIDEDYQKAFKELNTLLAGIKNLRPFHQLEEAGRKCIVDGERNVKFYRKNREERKPAHEKLFQAQNEVTVLEHDDDKSLVYKYLQPGEGLSAVSFTKRKYKGTQKEFDSTAKIALSDLLFGEVNGKKLWDDEALEKFKKFFRDEHFDEQLLFEENLTRSYFDKHALFTSKVKGKNQHEVKSYLNQKANEAALCYKKLKAKVEAEYADKPFTKYYALIQFDGDNMGKWLAGDENLLKPGTSGKLDLENFHRDFTAAVSGFAEAVEKNLKAPKGKTVFAGGEDFLGFINLHHLFSVMGWLNQLFADKVDKALRKNGVDYAIAEGAALTLSAGVVIAHYKEPLSEVLKAANEVEKMAKESGRNCFVVKAIRHAGGDTTCQLKWTLANGRNSTDALQHTMEKLETDFSSNFIAQIIRSIQMMQFQPPRTLVAKEMGRTLTRSYKLEKNAGETQEQFKERKKQAVNNFLENLEMVLSEIAPGEFDESQPQPDKAAYENIASLLSLFDFITRKTR
ncbi:MAG TPA: type III-B CRISPR-associated protein Cas10/Cmr2 [Bacteroidetes bacterium]|nr:type III-B CRISPR-associated protein Cas10/Cmr2 [Bacteroidota bacterium]